MTENSVDLPELNRGKPVKFNVFFMVYRVLLIEMHWKQLMREGVISTLTWTWQFLFMISKKKVSKDFPEGTAIPSENYSRLQFWPTNPYIKSAIYFTGKFNVKYMVQSRQLRSRHVDSH